MKKITVLLQVKNAERYINECVESILNQTYADFDLLIIDDQSSDRTVELISSYEDERSTILFGTAGYIENLNYGIEISNSLYIARMDGDDLMLPDRLEKQLAIMESTGAAVCSTWMNVFGEENYLADGPAGLIVDPIYQLYEGNFLAHPTVMLNKAFLMDKKLRYEHYFPTEDYKLWSEIAKKNGTFYIIPEPLLNYRRSYGQLSIAYGDEMRRQDWRIKTEIAQYLLEKHQS